MDMHRLNHTATTATKRVHGVIPEELLIEIDALVGPRLRCEFLADAAREKVARERLWRVAHEYGGALKDAHIPGWETPRAASAWVHALRVESDERAFSDEHS